jgi:hypothetical protein
MYPSVRLLQRRATTDEYCGLLVASSCKVGNYHSHILSFFQHTSRLQWQSCSTRFVSVLLASAMSVKVWFHFVGGLVLDENF